MNDTVRSAVSDAKASHEKRHVEIDEVRLAEEEKKREALRAAHDALRTSVTAFPIDRLAISPGDEHSKVVLMNDAGEPDPKSIAVLEFPPVAVVMAQTKDEGDAGQGDFTPARNLAHFTFSVACENSKRDEELPFDITEHQEKLMAVCKEAGPHLLGLWFDSSAKQHCLGGFDKAMEAARSEISGADKAKYPKAESVMAAEKKDEALRERVKELARSNFIATGKYPFCDSIDENGNPITPVAYIRSKVYSVIKGRWNPKMSKEGPKGPSVDEIPTATENMQRVREAMKKHNYVFHPIQFKRKVAGGKRIDLVRPKVLVPKTDSLGNRVTDQHGKTVMVAEDDISFDPLHEELDEKTGVMKKIRAMVQFKASFALSNGGTKNRQTVTLNLFGEVTIVKTDEVDGGDIRDYGDFGVKKPVQNDDDDGDTNGGEGDNPGIGNLPGVADTSLKRKNRTDDDDERPVKKNK